MSADAPLMEAGLDSLGAVELRNQLQRAAGEGVTLPTTVVFDHPTARHLADFFAAGAAAASGDAAAALVSLGEVLQLVRRTAGGSVDADAPLMEAGLDSLGAVELRNQLQHAAGEGVALPSTVVFDHPTARQLAELFVVESGRPLGASTGGTVATRREGGVSLASLRAELPGGAVAESQAWRLSATGTDAFSPSPASRWAQPSGGPTLHGAFVRRVELFDHHFFFISAVETCTMDPQQRHLLELGYAALHASGQTRASLMGSTTAIFVGVCAAVTLWSRAAGTIAQRGGRFSQVMSTEFRSAVEHENAYTMTGTGCSEITVY